MTDIQYLRIKDPATGHEYTYDAAKVEALGLQKHVINKDALGPDGLPAPVKLRLPLGEPLPGGKVDRARTTKKTAAKKAAPTKKTTEAKSPGEDAGQTSAAPETEN